MSGRRYPVLVHGMSVGDFDSRKQEREKVQEWRLTKFIGRVGLYGEDGLREI